MKVVKYIFIALVFIVVSFPEIESEYEAYQENIENNSSEIFDKIGDANGFYWENKSCGYITKIVFKSDSTFTITAMMESMPIKKIIFEGEWKKGTNNTKVYAKYKGVSKQIRFHFYNNFTTMKRNDTMIFKRKLGETSL